MRPRDTLEKLSGKRGRFETRGGGTLGTLSGKRGRLETKGHFGNVVREERKLGDQRTLC